MEYLLWSIGFILLPFIVVIILGLIAFLYCIITIVIPEFIKAIYKGINGEKYE